MTSEWHLTANIASVENENSQAYKDKTRRAPDISPPRNMKSQILVCTNENCNRSESIPSKSSGLSSSFPQTGSLSSCSSNPTVPSSNKVLLSPPTKKKEEAPLSRSFCSARDVDVHTNQEVMVPSVNPMECASPLTPAIVTGEKPGRDLSLEWKLARSIDRRKRIEGRFHRERAKRHASEHDRDRLLAFVKGLVTNESMAQDNEQKSYKRRRPKTSHVMDEEEKGAPFECDTELRRTILDFLNQYNQCQLNQNGYNFSARSRSSSIETSDFHSTSDDEEYKSGLDRNDKDQQKIPMPPPLFCKEAGVENDYEKRKITRSDSASVLETDVFAELPVRFRSVRELEFDSVDFHRNDDEDESSLATQMSLREQDLQRAKDLESHAKELKDLYNVLEETKADHKRLVAELKRRFVEESKQREELLERALGYAEKLEGTERRNAQALQTKDRIIKDIREIHAQTLDIQKRQHLKDISQEREACLEEAALRHSEEFEALKQEHASEVKKIMEEASRQHEASVTLIVERHNEELRKARDLIVETSSVSDESDHNRVLKTLKREMENDTLQHSQQLEVLRKRHQEELSIMEHIVTEMRETHNLKVSVKDDECQQEQAEQRWKHTQEELEKTLDLLKERDSRIERHQKELRELQEVVENRTYTITELQEDIKARDAKVVGLEIDLDQERRRYESCNERVNELFQQYESRIQELEDEKKIHTEDLCTMREKVENIQEDHQEEVQGLKDELKTKDILHAEDIDLLVSRMNTLYMQLDDRTIQLQDLGKLSAESPKVKREDDQGNNHSSSFYQSQYLQEAMKKKRGRRGLSWFTSKRLQQMSMCGSVSDATSVTAISVSPDSSCRSDSSGDSDEGSVENGKLAEAAGLSIYDDEGISKTSIWGSIEK